MLKSHLGDDSFKIDASIFGQQHEHGEVFFDLNLVVPLLIVSFKWPLRSPNLIVCDFFLKRRFNLKFFEFVLRSSQESV